MKDYDEYMLDRLYESMTKSEAEKILGLSGSYTFDDMTKTARSAMMGAHPDRGGNAEDFKKIRAAQNTLEKILGGKNNDTATISLDSKREQVIHSTYNELKSKFNPEEFNKYFSDVFGGEPFEYSVDMEFPKGNLKYVYNVSFTSKWFNKDKTKVFELYVSANITDVMKSSGSLASSDTSDDVSYGLSVVSYGYANKRKVKVAQRDWQRTSHHSVLFEPSKLFPKTKIVKSKTSKFSKKDMLLFMKNELSASETDKDYYMVPLKDGLFLGLNRVVLMRVPGWSITGTYEKKNYSYIRKGTVYGTFPETEEAADFFKKLSKMNSSEAEKTIEHMKNKFVW